MSFVSNKVGIDWITATTRKGKAYLTLLARVIDDCKCGKEREHKGRYHGVYWDGTECNCGFLGLHNDGSRNMYIYISSGINSDTNISYEVVISPDWKVTRVDVQLTVEGNFRANVLGDYLRKNHVSRGKKPKITAISQGDGKNETVYIGSRKSVSYTRIYVKEGGDGKLFTRIENEIKGAYASEFVSAAINNGMDAAMLDSLSTVVSRFDMRGINGVCEPLGEICDVLDGNGSLPSPTTEKSEDKTMKWLREQVSPAILRVSNSNDVGTVRELESMVSNWLLAIGENLYYGG